ncbi:MAG: hypothetical protein U0992_22485 [Planctomycetaceae bacterium]
MLTQALAEAVRAKRVAWSAECGELMGIDGRQSSLADELSSLNLTQTNRGTYRMDHVARPG